MSDERLRAVRLAPASRNVADRYDVIRKRLVGACASGFGHRSETLARRRDAFHRHEGSLNGIHKGFRIVRRWRDLADEPTRDARHSVLHGYISRKDIGGSNDLRRRPDRLRGSSA